MQRRIMYMLGSSPMKTHSGLLRHRGFLDGLSARHDVRLLVCGRADASHPPAIDGATAGTGGWTEAVEGVTVRSRPGLTGFDVGRARRRVVPMIDSWCPDVIIADKYAGVVLPVGSDTPVIIDFCDAKSAHHARRLRFERTPKALARLARSVLLEQSAARRASIATFVSERDRSEAWFLRPPPRIEVVGNGVDVEYWTPPARGGRAGVEHGRPSLILTGRMDYPPNVDGAIQLCRNVLPRVAERVPAVRVVVAGADPTAEVRSLESDNVEVTGTVDDLRPFIGAATLFVAPLRFGAGVQNKVLEALAMGLPVVTTPLVADGLLPARADAVPAPVFRCEIDEMADLVTSLLAEGDRSNLDDRRRAGREWVTANCSWAAAVDRLDALVEDLSR